MLITLIKNRTTIFLVLTSLLFYLVFAYDLDRSDFIKLIILIGTLFFIAYKIIQINKDCFWLLTGIGITFRLLFIAILPNLSQDFYRFIWDGQMIISGFNPYLTTPDFQMEMGIISNFPNQLELYNGMGQLSASHFTNYPPINQLCFVIANLFPGKSIISSVVGLRLIIIAADIGILYFGKKLLEALKLSSSRIWWYMLNPFIIIELTGNLHFESVMIFFLIWSLYLLHSGKWKLAAIIFACSISVKLIPLLFLPIFYWWFSPKENRNKWIPERSTLLKLIGFYIIVLATTVLLFIPFFSMEFINNYAETVGLWFNDFEFNASIYYIVREIGYFITGYNEIAIIGKILPAISLVIILWFSLLRKNTTLHKLTTSIVIVFTCYLFLSTTVHPWYLGTLVALCIFTNYRFPLVWSFAIILSYLAYLSIGTADKSENLWIIGLEYAIVFSAFIWEVILRKKISV